MNFFKNISLIVILNIIFLQQTFSQQNLFNIPSCDSTYKNKLFYQHQLNLYKYKLESKIHLVYGLGKGWDAGLNLVGKGFYFAPEWRALHNDNPSKGALYPIIMGTLQKQFVLSEKLLINGGTQIGWNLSSKINNKKVNHFSYIVASYHIFEGFRGVFGGYYTNRMYVGEGNIAGVMAGYEIKLSKRWYLMGDWVSGNNDASVTVLGGMYNLSKRVQVCAGWQIPNPKTPKDMGVVLELNIMGWDVF